MLILSVLCTFFSKNLKRKCDSLQYKYIYILAFLTLCIILLNTFWGVIFFTSLDKGGNHRFIGPAIVVLTHMLFSCIVSLFSFRYIFNQYQIRLDII